MVCRVLFFASLFCLFSPFGFSQEEKLKEPTIIELINPNAVLLGLYAREFETSYTFRDGESVDLLKPFSIPMDHRFEVSGQVPLTAYLEKENGALSFERTVDRAMKKLKSKKVARPEVYFLLNGNSSKVGREDALEGEQEVGEQVKETFSYPFYHVVQTLDATIGQYFDEFDLNVILLTPGGWGSSKLGDELERVYAGSKTVRLNFAHAATDGGEGESTLLRGFEAAQSFAHLGVGASSMIPTFKNVLENTQYYAHVLAGKKAGVLGKTNRNGKWESIQRALPGSSQSKINHLKLIHLRGHRSKEHALEVNALVADSFGHASELFLDAVLAHAGFREEAYRLLGWFKADHDAAALIDYLNQDLSEEINPARQQMLKAYALEAAGILVQLSFSRFQWIQLMNERRKVRIRPYPRTQVVESLVAFLIGTDSFTLYDLAAFQLHRIAISEMMYGTPDYFPDELPKKASEHAPFSYEIVKLFKGQIKAFEKVIYQGDADKKVRERAQKQKKLVSGYLTKIRKQSSVWKKKLILDQ